LAAGYTLHTGVEQQAQEQDFFEIVARNHGSLKIQEEKGHAPQLKPAFEIMHQGDRVPGCCLSPTVHIPVNYSFPTNSNTLNLDYLATSMAFMGRRADSTEFQIANWLVP
jgi:hypothetical protein